MGLRPASVSKPCITHSAGPDSLFCIMDSRTVFIAACSPRRGGNSDHAAALLGEAWGLATPAVRVADAGVRPCISCGFCASRPGLCSLDGTGPHGEKDGAQALFSAMCAAELSVIVAPVYFYHLPAQAKAWIDRSQRWWAVEDAASRPGAGRTMTAVLMGARPRGDKLFEGADRTLRYMAKTLGMEWHPPLYLYGLDGPDALVRSAEKQAQLRNWATDLRGARAWA